jgi:uncharacterized membrane protein YfcA
VTPQRAGRLMRLQHSRASLSMARVTVPELLLLAAAGVVAGAASAMAGGASLLTFPVLLALGLPPLDANVTNTTGLIPTAVGAALASREELEGQRSLMIFLCPPMIAGSLTGAAILLLTPPGVFGAVVPFLIAGSALLLLVQPWIIARAGQRLCDGNRRGAWIAAGCVAVYAGYFGAAAAVLFMALVGLFTTVSLHRLNALKNVLLGISNAFAALLFALVAPIYWPAACALALGSLAGGAGGIRLVRRVPPRPLRIGVAVIGLSIAAWLVTTGA